MRTFSKSAIMLAFLLALSLSALAQKTFQGQIKYTITYEGMELDESTKSFLPGEMTFFLKENKSRSELKTGMGDQVTIFNGDSKTSINLMNIMDRKIAIKKTTEEIKLERKRYHDLKVVYSNETKEIAGHLCNKAVIEVNAADFNGASSFTVFYTDELGNPGINYSDALFNQIKGVMLEYEIIARGLLMRFSASEINKETISDDLFTVPSDYKEMTRDELKRLFGSN